MPSFKGLAGGSPNGSYGQPSSLQAHIRLPAPYGGFEILGGLKIRGESGPLASYRTVCSFG